MRVGQNPEKDKEIHDDAYHRIIVPIYVPNLEGYFEKGLEVTKLCLDSLFITKHEKCRVSIVDNGSCKEVREYLQERYRDGNIDQLVQLKQNVGKIDAVIPIAKNAVEALVTISDGDVLFLDGWVQAVESVYVHFPEAGMVSPVPHGTTFANFTVNTLYDAYFKKLLKFQEVCDPEDMLRFAASIGREATMYKKRIRLKYQLTVSRKSNHAVVGCGHFVSTLRKEVFKESPEGPSKLAYATSADRNYIDIPNEKAGLWRLATTGNYAYHIGNQPEGWMQDFFKDTKGTIKNIQAIPSSKKNSTSFWFKNWVVRIMLSRYCRAWFFKRWGLKETNGIY